MSVGTKEWPRAGGSCGAKVHAVVPHAADTGAGREEHRCLSTTHVVYSRRPSSGPSHAVPAWLVHENADQHGPQVAVGGVGDVVEAPLPGASGIDKLEIEDVAEAGVRLLREAVLDPDPRLVISNEIWSTRILPRSPARIARGCRRPAAACRPVGLLRLLLRLGGGDRLCSSAVASASTGAMSRGPAPRRRSPRPSGVRSLTQWRAARGERAAR